MSHSNPTIVSSQDRKQTILSERSWAILTFNVEKRDESKKLVYKSQTKGSKYLLDDLYRVDLSALEFTVSHVITKSHVVNFERFQIRFTSPWATWSPIRIKFDIFHFSILKLLIIILWYYKEIRLMHAHYKIHFSNFPIKAHVSSLTPFDPIWPRFDPYLTYILTSRKKN